MSRDFAEKGRCAHVILWRALFRIDTPRNPKMDPDDFGDFTSFSNENSNATNGEGSGGEKVRYNTYL